MLFSGCVPPSETKGSQNWHFWAHDVLLCTVSSPRKADDAFDDDNGLCPSLVFRHRSGILNTGEEALVESN